MVRVHQRDSGQRAARRSEIEKADPFARVALAAPAGGGHVPRVVLHLGESAPASRRNFVYDVRELRRSRQGAIGSGPLGNGERPDALHFVATGLCRVPEIDRALRVEPEGRRVPETDERAAVPTVGTT